MVRQEWGCDKCGFRYHSHAVLKELVHHCPPKSNKTAPAKLIDGEPARERRKSVEQIVNHRLRTMSGKTDDPNPGHAEAMAAFEQAQFEEPVKPRGRVLKRRSTRVE